MVERRALRGLMPLVVVALVVGAALRLVWPNDIHYLDDEAWMCEHVQDARNGGPWQTLGMLSSRGVRNAGMSVWIFYALGIVSGASSPPALARAVAVLALVAYVAMLAIPIWFVRNERDKRSWIWATILVTTNPTLVFLDRKIWALVLPIFMVSFIVAWMKRDRIGGAFVWGFLGAILGQIHMPGFFFAPMLALFTKLFGRERTRWLPWFLGSAAGVLPALPWLLYLARERPHPTGSPWWLRFRLEFYQYFFSDPTGLTGEYTLGWNDLLRAMRWPIVFGHATWLVFVGHLVLAVCAIALAKRTLEALWENRRQLGSILRGERSETALLLAAVLGGMGVLMTLPSISIHRHYMLATFPLQYVFASKIALRKPGGEKWLTTLFAAGAIVSAGFLSFVHDVGENAEMGKTYATQQRLGITPREAKPEGHP